MPIRPALRHRRPTLIRLLRRPPTPILLPLRRDPVGVHRQAELARPLELAALKKEDQDVLADNKAKLEKMILEKIKEAKQTFSERKGLKVPIRVTNRYNAIVTRFRTLQAKKWAYL